MARVSIRYSFPVFLTYLFVLTLAAACGNAGAPSAVEPPATPPPATIVVAETSPAATPAPTATTEPTVAPPTVAPTQEPTTTPEPTQVPEVAVGTLQQAEGGVQIMTEAGWQEVQSLNIDKMENLSAEQLESGEIVFYYTINGNRIGFGRYENGKYVQEPIAITGRTAPEYGDAYSVVDALQLLEATSKTKGNFAVSPGSAGEVKEITYAIYNPDGEEAWQDPRFQQWLDAAPGLTMPAVEYVPAQFVGMPVTDAGAKVIIDTLNFAKGVSEDGKLYFPMGGDARTRTLSEYQSLPIEAVNPEKVVLLWAAHENPLGSAWFGI